MSAAIRGSLLFVLNLFPVGDFFFFLSFPQKIFPSQTKKQETLVSKKERKTEWQKKSKIEIPKTANIRLLIIRYLVTAEHEKKSET